MYLVRMWNWNFPTLLVEWKLVHLLWKTVRPRLRKLNILVTADPATPSLEMQSYAHHEMNRDVHSSTVHSNQEQETTQKSISRSSHRMEYYKATRMDSLTICSNTTESYTPHCMKAAGHTRYILCDSPINFQQRQTI